MPSPTPNVMSREVALVRADPAASEMTPLIEQPSGSSTEQGTCHLGPHKGLRPSRQAFGCLIGES